MVPLYSEVGQPYLLTSLFVLYSGIYPEVGNQETEENENPTT